MSVVFCARRVRWVMESPKVSGRVLVPCGLWSTMKEVWVLRSDFKAREGLSFVVCRVGS